MLSGAAALCHATSPADVKSLPLDPKIKIKGVKGFYRFVDEYGDTVRMTVFNDFYVYPPLKFKNKKQEEFYWRTVRDVRKTLPYAKLAFATLCETYEYIQTIPDKKKREKHLKQLEKDIFEQYKPVVKTMTKKSGESLAETYQQGDRPELFQYRESVSRNFPRRVLADFRKILRNEHESRLQPCKK